MRRLFLVALFVHYGSGSPTMCHCAGGQIGMSCPQPIQLSCPPMQCPPPPPCNPFPTFGTLMPLSGAQGLGQFTLPTLAPIQGSPFAPQTTPLPLPVSPPTNNYESLQMLQPSQHSTALQPQYQQQPLQPKYQQKAKVQTPPPALSVPPPPPEPQENVQNVKTETIAVDATTKVTTLPSESYVEADLPEGIPEEISSGKFPLYENQPNSEANTNPKKIQILFFDGYRQPARRALAPANGKLEVFTDKCNDEHLKKIIEENVDSSPSSSKRKIQKAAAEEIGGLFDVICSSHDFSYLANTQVFCEAGNGDVTCFAFLHSLIQ